MREEFGALCGEFEPLCGEFEPLCGEFEPLCGEFEPLCGEFEPLCGEFEPLCGEFRSTPCDRRFGRGVSPHTVRISEQETVSFSYRCASTKARGIV
jgi:hypothetical protein